MLKIVFHDSTLTVLRYSKGNIVKDLFLNLNLSLQVQALHSTRLFVVLISTNYKENIKCFLAFLANCNSLKGNRKLHFLNIPCMKIFSFKQTNK